MCLVDQSYRMMELVGVEKRAMVPEANCQRRGVLILKENTCASKSQNHLKMGNTLDWLRLRKRKSMVLRIRSQKKQISMISCVSFLMSYNCWWLSRLLFFNQAIGCFSSCWNQKYDFQTGFITMSFDPTHLVSQLTALNREDGDFRLTCDGLVVKAHSFILSLRYGAREYTGWLF